MTQQNPSAPAEQVIAPPRPAHATDRYDGPTVLYRMYDADDQLLYIGITCNPSKRWEGHRKKSTWWKLVARKELTTYPNRSAALTAELAAIRAERPLHNIANHPAKPSRHVHLVLSEERAEKLRVLAKRRGRGNSDTMYELLDEADMPNVPASSPPASDAALRTLLASVLEALDLPAPATIGDETPYRVLLADRALDAVVALRGVLANGDDPGWSADYLRSQLAEKPPTSYRALRCQAAHPDDPSPCTGAPVVTVLDATGAGADGCEHHAARMLASIEGGRVYGLPHAAPGTAVRVFQAAFVTHPFAWVNGPRTRPEQLSHAENRARGEGQ